MTDIEYERACKILDSIVDRTTTIIPQPLTEKTLRIISNNKDTNYASSVSTRMTRSSTREIREFMCDDEVSTLLDSLNKAKGDTRLEVLRDLTKYLKNNKWFVKSTDNKHIIKHIKLEYKKLYKEFPIINLLYYSAFGQQINA